MARPLLRKPKLWTAVPGASLAQTGRQLDIYGSMQATMVQLTGGVFLTAYALALGADPLVIAALAAMPLAVKMSQVFTSAHIERAGHWPRTALACATVARVFLLTAAAIPFVMDGPAAARVLVGVMALSSLAASFFDLALLTWMAELVPDRIRGRFLGARNRFSGLIGQAAALAAAIGVQGLAGPDGPPATMFAAFFGAGALLGLVALPVLAAVPPPRRARSRVQIAPLRRTLVAPLGDGNFRMFLLFAVLWHIALGMSSPFLVVLMLEHLDLTLVDVTALSALTTMIAAGTMSYWGKLGDHFGAKTVLRAGTYLIALSTIFWLTVTPERTWPILIIQAMAGVGWGAYNTNVNNLMLKIAPVERGPSYVASLGAVAGLAEALGPLAGGLILALLSARTPSDLLPYYVVALIAFVLRAVATFVPGHVHEPGGVPVGHMVRTMSRFRSMNVETALSPLFTHVYTHVARVADFIAREPAMARHQARQRAVRPPDSALDTTRIGRAG